MRSRIWQSALANRSMTKSRRDPDPYLIDARARVAAMNLVEKASLCSGRDAWSTRPIERLGVPSFVVADGPHGLRKSVDLDVAESIPATCFPTASALASSWNTALMHEVGAAIGDEAQAHGVNILLGPGVNMKRSPLGGRNFEYFSEDPVLCGTMAAAFIAGVQSRGVGTSVKHFAANNQELERMAGNSVLDERTLFEIYLPAFEIAVRQAAPWTVMCAYNQVNGVFASEHEELLTKVLRDRFGFSGIVISDWGAVHDRVAGVRAGLHLEMPGNGGLNDRTIVEAVAHHVLEEAVLDELVAQTVATALRAEACRRPEATFDVEAHDALARRASGESIVLLKNEHAVLPIDRETIRKIAVVGAFAKDPRFQGAGSSQVNPTKVAVPYDELVAKLGPSVQVTFEPGYDIEVVEDLSFIESARRAAAEAELALVFVGLPDSFESEGFDRERLDLPQSHLELVGAVATVQPRTVVVLVNGAAVTMPFAGDPHVLAIVEAWLGGQAGGAAIADVLTGAVNPSGKLSETFPRRLQDTPTSLEFPGRGGVARYGEGIYIGYRYYDKKDIEPLFPFGHGLSYTEFAYSQISLDRTEIDDSETVAVEVTVANTGSVAGKEVVQLYVRHCDAQETRPEQELRRFAKIDLAPGQSSTVKFELGFRDFAAYDLDVHDFLVHTGRFEIRVGSSSRHLPLRAELRVLGTQPKHTALTRESMIKTFAGDPRGNAVYEQIMTVLLAEFAPKGTELTPKAARARAKSARMMEAVVRDLPLYKLATLFGSYFSAEDVEMLCARAGIR